MSLAFLSAAGPAAARSPLHAVTERDGARFEPRDGWLVAVAFDGESLAAPVRWSDQSHLRKTQVRDPRAPGALPITGSRALVLGEPAPAGLDVTTQLAAIRLAGALARETVARFCALDLRPHRAPPGSFLPGSVARTPGYVLVEEDGLLLLVGAAYGEYLWDIVADAGTALGGGPVGA